MSGATDKQVQHLKGCAAFNINSNVRVKLTREGVRAWYSHYERYGIITDGPVIDSDGYTKFQMWNLMEIFGEHINMAGPLMFETEIILIGDNS